MKLNVKSYLAWPLATALVVISACGPSTQQGQVQQPLLTKIEYAAAPYNFRMLLTDAPLRDAAEVNVVIKHVEVLLAKGSTDHRVIIADNVGMVDLLKLRNDVFKNLRDMKLPEGVTIKEIRMILEEEGHHVLKTNGDICQMKTPSAQQSGVKLKLQTPLTLESGYSYVLVVDFDAEKSVVMRGGNNGCLLKPVIKVKTVVRALIPPAPSPTPAPSATPDDGSGSSGGTDGGAASNPTPPSDSFPTPDSGSGEQVDVGGGETDGSYTDNTGTGPINTTPEGELFN